MSTSLRRNTFMAPAIFEDFLKPFNEWMDDSRGLFRTKNIPSVNITENNNEYELALAAPGLAKEDFKIDVDGNMLSISSEKEESTEDKQKNYTRQEYSYSSFSRSFNIPEDVKKEDISANYKDGVLHVKMPRINEPKKNGTKKQVMIS